MDKEGLREYIAKLLTDSTVEQLNTFNEPAVNHQIILSVLRTLEYLKAEQSKSITEKLFLLENDESKKLITDTIHRQKQKESWQKYKMAVLVIVTAIICLLIYFSSH